IQERTTDSTNMMRPPRRARPATEEGRDPPWPCLLHRGFIRPEHRPGPLVRTACAGRVTLSPTPRPQALPLWMNLKVKGTPRVCKEKWARQEELSRAVNLTTRKGPPRSPAPPPGTDPGAGVRPSLARRGPLSWDQAVRKEGRMKSTPWHGSSF